MNVENKIEEVRGFKISTLGVIAVVFATGYLAGRCSAFKEMLAVVQDRLDDHNDGLKDIVDAIDRGLN